MNVIFVSSRGRGRQEYGQQNRTGDTINITVPSDLVLRLLPQGAILQMQIGPVPLRPDLARPSSRPDSGRSPSKHPNLDNVRPISPYTDCSSLGEAEVILINSGDSDNDYVPHSPMYEPDSPGPEPMEEPEDPRPGPSREEGAPNVFTHSRDREPSREEGATNIFTNNRDREPSREVGAPNIPDPRSRDRASNDISTRPRNFGRGRGIPIEHVTPFFRGTGQRRHFLVRIRPM